MAFFSESEHDAVMFEFETPKSSEISRGPTLFPKVNFVEPFPAPDISELSESTWSCVAPHASTKANAAETPIRPAQETGLTVHGPSSSQTPSNSQMTIGGMEQEATSFKVLNDSATPACVNMDVAKSCDKAKGKREASGMTANDPDKGRPLKRARSDCATAQKYEDFFILDANTVIEVDEVLFKLHRSRLVTKSLFFAELLEHHDKGRFPNDDVRVENDDKATVYHLGNTTADDFVALLKFDDNPTEYYFQTPPFSVLAPILRAATALHFETYRVWAARILGQTWSSSLADITPERKENAADVIVLARSCDVDSGVKRALYELARTRLIGLHGHDVLEQPGLEQIGRADQRCVELMRELLVTTWSEVAVRIGTSSCQEDRVRNFNTSSSWGKKKKSSAPREICAFKNGTPETTWNERVHHSGLYTKFLFDPVCGAQALINIPWEDEGWCSDCIQSRRATWRNVQQNLWSDMNKWIPGNE